MNDLLFSFFVRIMHVYVDPQNSENEGITTYIEIINWVITPNLIAIFEFILISS